MTPYATVQDCIDRRGSEAVTVLQDESDTDAPLKRALADASEIIDGYVGARHALPLISVPGILTAVCVDIAMDRAAADAARSTEIDRARAKEAREILRDVSRGRVSLGAADPDPPAEAESPAVSIDSAPRVMTRRSLRGIL